MSCPLVSVSGVRVSLQVITMHPMERGAWDLCSWCVALALMIQARRKALGSWLIAECYFQTESGFSLAAGFPPLMCSSMMSATSASVTLEYQVASG